MLLDIIQKGSTNVSLTIRIMDSTDGTPETAVEHNTTGIDLWYRREGAAVSSITEVALAALTTAHTDGGIEHIGHGYYRLDVPDAAFATGASYVEIGGTVTGMVVYGGRVKLVDYDPEDGTRLGLTALPNAAADAAGGLPISDTGGLDLDAISTAVGAVADAAAAGDPSATESIMQYVKQLVNVLVGTTGVTTYPAEAAPANNVSLAEVIRAIHADVTGLNGDAMRGTDGANTTTPLSAAGVRAAIGMASANLDTQLTAIVGDTNELQTDWANGGRLDLILDARASQSSVDTIDANVDAILVDTGTTLPASLATIDGNVDAVLVDTNELQTDWANGAGLT